MKAGQDYSWKNLLQKNYFIFKKSLKKFIMIGEMIADHDRDRQSWDFQNMIVSDRRSWFGKMIVSDRRSRKKVSCLTLCDMFQYFLPATWEYLKTTRKDRMKCSFAALKEFDTKLQLHVYSFYKFYISRTITFFQNCWVLHDVYIEWSQIISEQFF